MKIHFVIDSGSNFIKLEDTEKISYSIVPLRICTDERDFCDDATLDVGEMVDYLEHTKLPSHSACPGVEDWKREFEGYEYVIAITLTGALSGCYNACRLAAEEYMEDNEGCKVFALDTQLIGPVEKLCTEFAANKFNELISMAILENETDTTSSDFLSKAQTDKIFEELCEALKDYCTNHVFIGFCLKSLNNLANNGRVNKAVAKLSKTLKIHIAGDFADGELRPKDKVRGEKKGVESMFNNMIASGYKGGRVIIDHCFSDGMAKSLLAMIKEEYPDASIVVGPTTGLCSFYAERGGVVVGYER